MPDFPAYKRITLPRAYLAGFAGTEQLISIDSTRGPIRVKYAGSTTDNVFGVTAGTGAAPAGKPFYLVTSGAEGRLDSQSTSTTGYGGGRGSNDTSDEMNYAVYGSAVAGQLFTGVDLARSANLITNATGGLVIGTFAARAVYLGANSLVCATISATSAYLLMSRRFQEKQGANVESAATIAIGDDGNVVIVSGSTTVDTISRTGWQDGSVICIEVDDVFDITDAGNIQLDGNVTFSMSAGDTLTLRALDGGTNWREVSRSVR